MDKFKKKNDFSEQKNFLFFFTKDFYVVFIIDKCNFNLANKLKNFHIYYPDKSRLKTFH